MDVARRRSISAFRHSHVRVEPRLRLGCCPSRSGVNTICLIGLTRRQPHTTPWTNNPTEIHVQRMRLLVPLGLGMQKQAQDDNIGTVILKTKFRPATAYCSRDWA